ncbi:hypothetical protein GCM10010307_02940 [Streptomyces vastus]|uniref:Uncharacterized protein n=1 Tax=Streptomyces vastus TaxID=285451 RepID=A0ABN3Q9J0_9ACTN
MQYKAGTREHIEKDLGYEVIANFGDQYSDLEGGYADEVQAPEPDVLRELRLTAVPA